MDMYNIYSNSISLQWRISKIPVKEIHYNLKIIENNKI